MSWWPASPRGISWRRACGAWRGWARERCSTDPSTRCCRPRRRRDGLRRFSRSPKRKMRSPPSVAAPAIPRATFFPKGDFVETGLWCLARLGSRTLFYGPINQVLPPSTAGRWIEAILKIPKAEDAVAALARRTGDSTRDLLPHTVELVRRAFPGADLDAEPKDNLVAMGKVFGEELPSGLVFHE